MSTSREIVLYTGPLKEANQAGSSSGMEFLAFQKAFTFLFGTAMIIKSFISDRHSSIAKWMKEDCLTRCREIGKPAVQHFFDSWHIAKNYVAEIYKTLTTTPRAELKLLEEELKHEVPDPMHSMLEDKEDKGEAIIKYKRRKERETVIIPPTCTAQNLRNPGSTKSTTNEENQKPLQELDVVRFAIISSDEIHELKSVPSNKNTSRFTKQWMNVFRSWCQCRHLEYVSIKTRAPEELDKVLSFDVDKNWDAEELHKQFSSLLKGTEMEDLRFEIVKNCGGTLLTPNIPSGKKIDATLLFKSISPTGHIIVKLLDYPPHVDKEIEEMLSKSVFDFDHKESEIDNNDVILVEAKHQPSSTSTSAEPAKEESTTATVSPATCEGYCDIDYPFDIQSILDKAKSLNLSEPLEVLRFLQQEINEGRELDMSTSEETLEGDVNLITVNHDNLLESTFSELEFICKYRCTFCVDFMGEEYVDQGGPRKQWIRLVNQAIKKKYFDQGLCNFLSKDYFFVGLMITMAMLQNGQMPTYIEEDLLQEILSSSKTSSPCVPELQRGLEQLGMLSALCHLPMLQYLLRPGAEGKLTVPILQHLLKPSFSEEGSNALKYEKEVYQLFVRYIREVASGRRSCGEKILDLSNILEFVTGASHEPALGFVTLPVISFVIPNEITKLTNQVQTSEKIDVKGNFIPTAHTCGNVLSLPRLTQQLSLPSAERLFSLYDLAFSQDYFGKI
ncbi:hypothetical protein AWC38_SpisGene18315 [Stylophora pistillata]|uniref:HECT-type E3 ubiquitin transferase n=1 Tax=Stylophora pistillata TaxID=50429 RepID=A0A2B4RMB4_STYPI|nr:hypothetical protein AWC38_SpisGene18315 [Stylophora pistillata]